jgi:hypothetical protein
VKVLLSLGSWSEFKDGPDPVGFAACRFLRARSLVVEWAAKKLSTESVEAAKIGAFMAVLFTGAMPGAG